MHTCAESDTHARTPGAIKVTTGTSPVDLHYRPHVLLPILTERTAEHTHGIDALVY